MIYTPRDWYWTADDGRVFSSARQATVGRADPSLAAFESAGGTPTRWPVDDAGEQTTAALQDVLTPYGLYVDFASLQAALCTDIDKQAQTQRDIYVTPGGAQSATYLIKQSQAQAALAAQAANTAANMTADALAVAYPYLANEIGITADPTSKAAATDVYGVARAVMAVLQTWQPINLQIEAMRLKTKAAITAAGTAAAAQAAHDAVTWPAPPAA